MKHSSLSSTTVKIILTLKTVKSCVNKVLRFFSYLSKYVETCYVVELSVELFKLKSVLNVFVELKYYARQYITLAYSIIFYISLVNLYEMTIHCHYESSIV